MVDPDLLAFTFPEIHRYRLLGVWKQVCETVLLLGLFFYEFNLRRSQGSNAAALGVMGAYVLLGALSVVFSSRLKYLAKLVNLRFAAEFTLRTGSPYPADVDVLQVKRTVAVHHEDGTVSLWKVKRRRDWFTITPT